MGDRHDRAWHPTFGAGWLVKVGVKSTGYVAMRFEPDGGSPIEMRVVVMERGRPGVKGRGRKNKTALEAEDEHWMTYTLVSREVMTFRDAEPPPAATEPVQPATQTSMFGGT
jgi:hypothetical protein